MAITDYASLQTSIATWLDRTDLTAVIPDFITLFEAQANVELNLRTRFNSATAVLATTAGVNTVALPTDFLEARSIVVQTDPKIVLASSTPSQQYAQFPNAAPDRPKSFLINNGNLELAPVPDAAYSLLLYYYQKITPLSVNNTTNWLLDNFPNLYLFGCLTGAEAYLGSDPRIKIWGDFYNNFLQSLGGAVERGQYGYSAMTVKTDIAV